MQPFDLKNSLPHAFGKTAEWLFWTKSGFITHTIMKSVKRVYLSEVSVELQTVESSIQALKETLPDFIQEITPDEKNSVPAMGDKSFAFVQKAFEYSNHNAFMVPSFVILSDFQKQQESIEIFRRLSEHLAVLLKGMEDTSYMISSDAYKNALAIYKQTKEAAKNNVPGAQTIYEDLKVRFESQGQRKKKSKPNNAA